MSAKGKEKAVDVPAEEPSDPDLDFFISKAPIKRSTLPPRPKNREPSPEYITDSDESADDDEGRGGVKRKRKKRKRKESAKSDLPEWTRKRSISTAPKIESRSKDGRGRSTSAQAKEAIIVLSDDEEEGSTANDPAAAARKKRKVEEAQQARWRLELTPPPDLSEEREKELSRIIAEHIVIEIDQDNDDADAEGAVASAPASPTHEAHVPPNDQAVNLNISMKLDPVRKEAGMSEIAIRSWEKQRRIIIGRRDPILRAIKILAEKLSRRPEDLVLVHRDQPIHATGLAPMALGMGQEVELVGYEKSVWDRMEQERKARLLSAMTRDDAGPTTTDGDSGHAAGHSEAVNIAGEPSPPKAPARIALKLRGSWGEHSFGVKGHHTVGQVVAYYCTKVGRAGQEAKVRFMWDGDAQDPEVTMEELEVESGDSVDMMING